MQISEFLVKKMLFYYNFLWIIVKKSNILERVSFEQHEEFQINFLNKLQKSIFWSWDFLKYST